jgi:hypothetical protein
MWIQPRANTVFNFVSLQMLYVEERALAFRDTPGLVPSVYEYVNTVVIRTLFLISGLSFADEYLQCKFCGSGYFL